MKHQSVYFVLAIIMILLSTPLGYLTINTLYANQNLSEEYVPMLNGFIHSYMLIGILLFCKGIIDMLINKKD